MMQSSPTTALLNKALVDAHKLISNPVKNKVNPHFKNRYADLEATTACVRESLLLCGLTVVQLPCGDGMATRLLHVSGEWLESTTYFSEENPQKYGSALTYFRRYALQGLGFIVAEDDDDAELASKEETKKVKEEW